MIFMRSASMLASAVLAVIVKLSLGSEAVVKLSLESEVCSSCGADVHVNLLQARRRHLEKKEIIAVETGDETSTPRVVFIRAAGTSTMSSILQRYCLVHNKICSLHLPFQPGKGMVNRSTLLDYAKEHGDSDHVHIWDGHMEYSREAFEVLMPGAVTMSLFREPASRLISDDSYRSVTTEMLRQTLDNLKSNIADPGECRAMSDQVPSLSDVDFVALTEDYDRSLVLMAMALGWDLQDLLYHRVRESPEPSPEHQQTLDELRAYLKKPLSTMPEKAKEFVKMCYLDDIKMYDAANRTYHKQLTDMTPDQQAQVEYGVARLQSGLKALSSCCEEAETDPYCGVITTMQVIRELPDRYFESRCRHKALMAMRA